MLPAWHCAGPPAGKLPADNVYFEKGLAGFAGALQWLEDHLAEGLAALPVRDLSVFEVSLFCLVDHLGFRPTLLVTNYPKLVAFALAFAARPSALSTVYRVDP